MVVAVESELSPRAMLGACLGVEAAIGRVRTFRNAPRVIDIDLLLAQDYEEASPELTVPHPRMTERAFVLCPLQELWESGQLAAFELSSLPKPPAEQEIHLFEKNLKNSKTRIRMVCNRMRVFSCRRYSVGTRQHLVLTTQRLSSFL
jgi:hypothetical protein